MADVTVAQFAEVLKVPVDRLLQQLDQAGIKVDSAEDMISEDAKHELLTHLRRSHGHDDSQAEAAPRKITLKRKSQSELKLAGIQGRARTVNVEVRSKRTYIKREVLADQARHQQEEIDRQRETEEQAKAALEDLDRIKRCVRLGGFINAVPTFGDLPKVMNGASDLMVEVFGEAGRHARTTVGVAELPFDASVEVEALFEVD